MTDPVGMGINTKKVAFKPQFGCVMRKYMSELKILTYKGKNNCCIEIFLEAKFSLQNCLQCVHDIMKC